MVIASASDSPCPTDVPPPDDDPPPIVYVPEIQFFVVSTAMRMPLGSEACPPPDGPPDAEVEETLTESFRTSPAERFFVMSVFVSAAPAIRRLIFPGRK